MSGKLLRSALFGYKKSDVLEYIERLDERAEKRIKEKEAEAEAAKTELAAMKEELSEARKNREAIVSVLEIAQKQAKDMIERAEKSAEEIESGARTMAEKEKNNLNREIEIKKRDINNHFLSEIKKINALRKEIEEMRKTSVSSIKRFEQELESIDRALEQKESYTQRTMNSAEQEADSFFSSIRTVPIRVIKSDSNEENMQRHI